MRDHGGEAAEEADLSLRQRCRAQRQRVRRLARERLERRFRHHRLCEQLLHFRVPVCMRSARHNHQHCGRGGRGWQGAAWGGRGRCGRGLLHLRTRSNRRRRRRGHGRRCPPARRERGEGAAEGGARRLSTHGAWAAIGGSSSGIAEWRREGWGGAGGRSLPRESG